MYLEQEPDTNLFLLDLLRTRGIGNWTQEEWYAVWSPDHPDQNGATIRGMALLIGRAAMGQPARLGVPFGDPDACEVIGARARWNGPVDMLIGPRTASDALWRGLKGTPPTVFYDQRLYVCREPSPGPRLPLRPARTDEIPLIIEMAGQMMSEDLGVDPRRKEPNRHRQAIRHRVDEGRTLVGEQDGEIAFLLDVGTRRREGAQVGGTFVPPRFRGQGLSVMGMRAACDRLLREMEMVSLHVNEANVPAVRCYQRAGFQRDVPFRLLIR